MNNVKYGSVCSGIEAATVAWHDMGWLPAWFAEIEPFPSAVLAHHYPQVENLGNMTAIADRVRNGSVSAPDILVGGTPCQAFSVAGLRGGLSDPRGALTISYVDLANAIDSTRTVRGEQPCIIVWENVPGVLSSKDNAFGCFLGALAGEDSELQPPGGRWKNAGCVFGPQRTIAWRVLDAQYFGVAQRRRRVFVVASAREGFDPGAVLFEFDGVRRDTAPSREAGEEIAGTIEASLGRSRGAGTPISGITCMAHGQGGAEIREDSAPTLTCNHEAPIAAYCVHGTQDPCSRDETAFALGRNNGQENAVAQIIGFEANMSLSATSSDGVFHTLTRRNYASVMQPMGAVAFQSSQSGVRLHDTHATLDANNGPRRHNGALVGMQVRRLTPRECERLQGFPDDYTLIPVKGKPAADGPRYKALGNSMAVPCMTFIGNRIKTHGNHPCG